MLPVCDATGWGSVAIFGSDAAKSLGCVLELAAGGAGVVV